MDWDPDQNVRGDRLMPLSVLCCLTAHAVVCRQEPGSLSSPAYNGKLILMSSWRTVFSSCSGQNEPLVETDTETHPFSSETGRELDLVLSIKTHSWSFSHVFQLARLYRLLCECDLKRNPGASR